MKEQRKVLVVEVLVVEVLAARRLHESLLILAS
jgi:hypothetical protein